MNLKEALNKGIQILKTANIDAPAVEAGVILCFAIKCDKTFLFSHDEYILQEKEFEVFFDMLDRRAKSEPVQYITGHQEFMSLDFKVSPGVLIPRHDTETLVEAIINLKIKSSLNILDIGTGSGCIAISLAKYIGNSRVAAVDISEQALEIARLNAEGAGVEGRIEFIKSDLFKNLEGKYEKIFDIIVSNPPYISTKILKDLQPEVKDYEPLCALDGGDDGLDFYKSIINGSADFLKPEGILAFEVGFDQAESVSALMGEAFCGIRIFKDPARINRVVMGCLKEHLCK